MQLTWRVKPVLPFTKLLGAVAVLILVVAFGRHDPVQWALAVVVPVALIGWALRDVLVPVRLTADPEGLTVVAGIATRRRLPWAEIERVRVDRRTRIGLQSELLEVDAGESIYLFSAHELGAQPDEVATALSELLSRTS
jgi:hypothetical protein